jgi:hypothetical protein
MRTKGPSRRAKALNANRQSRRTRNMQPPKSFDYLGQTRIAKKLLPDQPGAKKLKQRFGDQLVCVRYRHDRGRNMRYTTVELLVDAAPLVKTDAPKADKVYVHIGPTEKTLRLIATSHGAKWDIAKQAWFMPRATAHRLHLLDRVII